MAAQIPWEGDVASIQPRIRLMRSYDQRQHESLGYVLRLDRESQTFSIAVGKGAHEKHEFRVGDRIAGRGVAVPDPRREVAELYRVSGIKLLTRGEEATANAPPFLGIPPSLQTYRERGHRRLATRTYGSKCAACIWGCEMPVEIIIDHWKPEKRRYR
ncbi:MAG: hypothetical protein ACYS0F_09875, partial [Planctomycetota bacterium]